MPNEPSLNESVGERIRRIRQERGLKTTELASRVGFGEAAIKKLEGGGSGSPSFENGLRIADALGVEPHELAFGEAQRRADLVFDGPDGSRILVEFKAGSGKTQAHLATAFAAQMPVWIASLHEGELKRLPTDPPAAGTPRLSPSGLEVAAELADLIHTLGEQMQALRARIETLEQGRRRRA